jgi:hypothetical protein
VPLYQTKQQASTGPLSSPAVFSLSTKPSSPATSVAEKKSEEPFWRRWFAKTPKPSGDVMTKRMETGQVTSYPYTLQHQHQKKKSSSASRHGEIIDYATINALTADSIRKQGQNVQHLAKLIRETECILADPGLKEEGKERNHFKQIFTQLNSQMRDQLRSKPDVIASITNPEITRKLNEEGLNDAKTILDAATTNIDKTGRSYMGENMMVGIAGHNLKKREETLKLEKLLERELVPRTLMSKDKHIPIKTEGFAEDAWGDILKTAVDSPPQTQKEKEEFMGLLKRKIPLIVDAETVPEQEHKVGAFFLQTKELAKSPKITAKQREALETVQKFIDEDMWRAIHPPTPQVKQKDAIVNDPLFTYFFKRRGQ